MRMNSLFRIEFGSVPARRRVRWRLTLALSTISMALVMGGCETPDSQGAPSAAEVSSSKLENSTTADLKQRRLVVLRRYAEIQREVELKAGLPMGLPIRDDRALLGDLYREAHEIERELLRRWHRGDPQVTMEQVKAGF